MKKRLLCVMCLSLMLVSVLVGCGDSKSNTGDVDYGDSAIENQHVSKLDIGLTMDLSGEYADCTIVDIPKSECELLVSSAVGGFNIVKEVNGNDVILSQLLVVGNTGLTDVFVRSQFPYTFSGNNYSVVASLPLSDTSSADYSTIQNLQSNLVSTSLMTVFLDETVFSSAPITENNVTENTVIENSVTSDVQGDISLTD